MVVALRPALFLDRDGIINEDTGHPHRIEDIRFLAGAFDLLRAGMARGLALVIVTNQGGIGRGLYTEDDFAALTRWMLGVLAGEGIAILAVEHCPDHPTAGIGSYRRESPRRKPAPGMILDAARAHALDIPASVMIGDRATDVAAGRAAGVGTTALVSASAAERAAVPAGTLLFDAVTDAATWLARGTGIGPSGEFTRLPPIAHPGPTLLRRVAGGASSPAGASPASAPPHMPGKGRDGGAEEGS